MLMDKMKQQARLSIIEKLKQKGAPQMESISPMPGSEPGMEENMNDIGITDELADRIKPRKKRKDKSNPLLEDENAVEPKHVLGGY